jgi:hypothetical protein
MTVIFDDEELYTALKIEAARRSLHVKDIVAEAVREWLELREDEELRKDIEAASKEWEVHGGVEAGEFFRQLQAEQQG